MVEGLRRPVAGAQNTSPHNMLTLNIHTRQYQPSSFKVRVTPMAGGGVCAGLEISTGEAGKEECAEVAFFIDEHSVKAFVDALGALREGAQAISGVSRAELAQASLHERSLFRFEKVFPDAAVAP